jgi:hypothetical protein
VLQGGSGQWKWSCRVGAGPALVHQTVSRRARKRRCSAPEHVGSKRLNTAAILRCADTRPITPPPARAACCADLGLLRPGSRPVAPRSGCAATIGSRSTPASAAARKHDREVGASRQQRYSHRCFPCSLFLPHTGSCANTTSPAPARMAPTAASATTAPFPSTRRVALNPLSWMLYDLSHQPGTPRRLLMPAASIPLSIVPLPLQRLGR